jgi:uncharacterized protein (DUF58 family)
MPRPEPAPGVYATLDDLVRLRHRAAGFSFLPRQPVQSLLAGRHASKLRGRGLDFEEIRRYLPGDDIRQIDWKVTARTRKPHARIYTEERERPVILVVDQRLGMFFGSRRSLKSVTAAEAAALAAWRTVAVKDRVGAVVFNDAETREVRPQRTRSTVLRILRSVVDLNHALRADAAVRPNPGMLNEALRRARRLAPHDCLVVLVSDGDGGDEETRRLVTEVARHNDVLVMFVFDPLEGDLPQAGRLVVSDGTRQLEIDTDSAALRTGLRADFDRRRADARRFLLTREVPVLPLSTDEPAVDQLARALGRRPRGAKP